MADIKLGREASIRLGETIVGRMNSFTLNEGNEELEVTSFGDSVMKYEYGYQDWSATISGFIDLDDSEQVTLRTAFRNRTKVPTIRFYVDSTAHYYCDVISDSEASALITAFTTNADNKSVMSFDMTVRGSGPLTDTGI